MSKQKTVREWFEELPDGEFKDECFENMVLGEAMASSLDEAIQLGCVSLFLGRVKSGVKNDIILKAIEQMQPKQVHEFELIKKLDEYIDLLNDELNETVAIASIHHWKSSRVEIGKQMREEIEALKKQINYNPIKSTVTCTIDGESFEIDPELAEQIRKGGGK